MKRISTILCLLICVVSSFAQSAKEIVSRMESEMEKHESDGFAMTVEMLMTDNYNSLSLLQ